MGKKIRATCGNGNGNGGWNLGIMNAALMGDARIASAQASRGRCGAVICTSLTTPHR
jgi:hypothetical protein